MHSGGYENLPTVVPLPSISVSMGSTNRLVLVRNAPTHVVDSSSAVVDEQWVAGPLASGEGGAWRTTGMPRRWHASSAMRLMVPLSTPSSAVYTRPSACEREQRRGVKNNSMRDIHAPRYHDRKDIAAQSFIHQSVLNTHQHRFMNTSPL